MNETPTISPRRLCDVADLILDVINNNGGQAIITALTDKDGVQITRDEAEAAVAFLMRMGAVSKVVK